jgi:hypothetical protein
MSTTTNTDQLMALVKKWREGNETKESEKGYVRGVMFAFDKCADELESILRALARPEDGEAGRKAWAIVRPDGVTIHPESVRGCERSAQWSIGEWSEMRKIGFTCVPVWITTTRPPATAGEDARDAARLGTLERWFEEGGVVSFRTYGPGSAGCELFTTRTQHVRGYKIRGAIDAALTAMGKES